jgi:hypothetical protein
MSMWFYKESPWYRDSMVYVVLQRMILVQIDSSFYVVLQRMILVQMETPVSMWFYKESYWYK